jgi:hypothetical protein
MAASSSRTYRGTDTGGIGGFVSIFPAGLGICAIAFLIAPFRWGTSPAIGVPVALVFFAAAYGLWRLSRRLRRASLTVGPDGVAIVNAGRRRELSWSEVTRFRAGTTPATSAFRGEVPVVVAELADGGSVAIDALKVDHGRLGAHRDQARVEQLCKQIESYRPARPAPAQPAL